MQEVQGGRWTVFFSMQETDGGRSNAPVRSPRARDVSTSRRSARTPTRKGIPPEVPAQPARTSNSSSSITDLSTPMITPGSSAPSFDLSTFSIPSDPASSTATNGEPLFPGTDLFGLIPSIDEMARGVPSEWPWDWSGVDLSSMLGEDAGDEARLSDADRDHL